MEATPFSAPAESPEAEEHAKPTRREVLRAVFELWPAILVVVALLIAIIAPFFAARIDSEKEPVLLTWTALAAAFSATTFAFFITLAWDRRQRVETERKELAAEKRREQAEVEAEQERRATEAKRRFSAILLELERLKGTLERCREQAKYKYFFPDLPTGSWEAANERLGVIVSDYALMADLSIFYGEVDELQWRLRFKANAWVEDAAINPIIDALVETMLESLEDLLHRVRKQTVNPDVARIHAEVVGGPTPARKVVTRAIRGVTVGRKIADAQTAQRS
jgi:hypothetical protein